MHSAPANLLSHSSSFPDGESCCKLGPYPLADDGNLTTFNLPQDSEYRSEAVYPLGLSVLPNDRHQSGGKVGRVADCLASEPKGEDGKPGGVYKLSVQRRWNLRELQTSISLAVCSGLRRSGRMRVYQGPENTLRINRASCVNDH